MSRGNSQLREEHQAGTTGIYAAPLFQQVLAGRIRIQDDHRLSEDFEVIYVAYHRINVRRLIVRQLKALILTENK